MTIVANGKPCDISEGMTVAAYLRSRALAAGQVVIEYNREPLHRERFADTLLRAGDVLEIAQMVGGG